MKLIQKTITTIEADEGKMLVRKSDGRLAGEQITLGYNYYEGGMPLREPHLETPDDYEETDKPAALDENGVEQPSVKQDDMKRIKRAMAVIRDLRNEMDTLGLTPQESLQVKDMYWHFGEGTFATGSHVTKRMKCQYGGKLYAVLQDHDILPHYSIDENTIGTLYAEVDEDYKEEEDEDVEDSDA